MVNGIVISFLISLIGTINLDFALLKKNPKSYFKGWLDNLKYGAIVAFVLAYVAMPSIVFPDILVPIFIVLAINCAYTLFSFMRKQNMIVLDRDVINKAKIPIALIFFIIVLWILTPIYPLFQAEELNKIPIVNVSAEKISSVDPTHIRQVPLEFADWKADKVVGELGNKVNVGSL